MLRTAQFDAAESFLFDVFFSEAMLETIFDDGALPSEEDSLIEVTTDARLSFDGERIAISYAESELTGMEGSETTVSFDPKEPGLVTMMRGGTVFTMLVFEAGRHHMCTYETPYSTFELGVYTRTLANTITEHGGKLTVDYAVELRGAGAQRTKLEMTVKEM